MAVKIERLKKRNYRSVLRRGEWDLVGRADPGANFDVTGKWSGRTVRTAGSRLDTRCISKAMLLPRVLFRDHTESKGEEISYLKKLHGYVLDNASRTRTASRLFNLSGLSWRYLSTTLTASPKVIAE